MIYRIKQRIINFLLERWGSDDLERYVRNTSGHICSLERVAIDLIKLRIQSGLPAMPLMGDGVSEGDILTGNEESPFGNYLAARAFEELKGNRGQG